MTDPSLDDARAQVAAACRILAAQGLVMGTAGNVSVRVGDQIVVTATGARFEDLSAEQVTAVTLEGEVLGELVPTSEIDLHLGVYRRFGSGAVVHTHSPVATAVGLVATEVPCIHYQMLLLGGAIRVAPYSTFGTPELADSVVEALDGRAAALMANHGAVTTPPILVPLLITRCFWNGRAPFTGELPRWERRARSTRRSRTPSSSRPCSATTGPPDRRSRTERSGGDRRQVAADHGLELGKQARVAGGIGPEGFLDDRIGGELNTQADF